MLSGTLPDAHKIVPYGEAMSCRFIPWLWCMLGRPVDGYRPTASVRVASRSTFGRLGTCWANNSTVVVETGTRPRRTIVHWRLGGLLQLHLKNKRVSRAEYPTSGPHRERPMHYIESRYNWSPTLLRN